MAVMIYDNNKRAWVRWPMATMLSTILGCATPQGKQDATDVDPTTGTNETEEALQEATPPADDCDWLPSADGFFYCAKEGNERGTDNN